MKHPPKQLELLPQRTATNITVREADLEATLACVRALGAILLCFSVRGGSYTLNVILPPGERVAEPIAA